MWFQEPAAKGGYFGLDGQSRRRAFLASPMAFSRVTSGFCDAHAPDPANLARIISASTTRRATGTAVRAVGDGIVDFAGWQNGYGNVVQIAHRQRPQTLYAHLSRIESAAGQRVEQGQRVGAVGATGWATGPHLHFEFRVGGQHQDPVTHRAQLRVGRPSRRPRAPASPRRAQTAQRPARAAAPAATRRPLE